MRLVANSASACQYLLNFTNQWLLLSGMRAKVPKYHCFAIWGSSAKVVDPQLVVDS